MSKITNIAESVKVNEALEQPTLKLALPHLYNSTASYYKKTKNLTQYDFTGRDNQTKKIHTILEIKNRTFDYNQALEYKTTIIGYNKYMKFCNMKLKKDYIQHFYIIIKFTDKLAIFDFMDNEKFRNNDFYTTNDDYYCDAFTRFDRNATKDHLFMDISKFKIF